MLSTDDVINTTMSNVPSQEPHFGECPAKDVQGAGVLICSTMASTICPCKSLFISPVRNGVTGTWFLSLQVLLINQRKSSRGPSSVGRLSEIKIDGSHLQVLALLVMIDVYNLKYRHTSVGVH